MISLIWSNLHLRSIIYAKTATQRYALSFGDLTIVVSNRKKKSAINPNSIQKGRRRIIFCHSWQDHKNYQNWCLVRTVLGAKMIKFEVVGLWFLRMHHLNIWVLQKYQKWKGRLTLFNNDLMITKGQHFCTALSKLIFSGFSCQMIIMICDLSTWYISKPLSYE